MYKKNTKKKMPEKGRKNPWEISSFNERFSNVVN